MALIYRRLALLTGARARVLPLARGWECLISGYIGRNTYQVGEYFRTRKDAIARRIQVNSDSRALVVSVEELLYPIAMVVAKYDTILTGVKAPTHESNIPEYSKVEDVFPTPRNMRFRPPGSRSPSPTPGRLN